MDEQPTPGIVPRQEHSLSRRFLDPDALKVLYRLKNHGFLAYLVGGCVRDLLLGKIPKDFDVATNAHPQRVRELFRNSRLIGRRFRLIHIYFSGGKFIEVSTFRRRLEFEETGPGNQLPADNTFGTPAEDALRRDITINGIFYNIADFSLVDYVGGLEDLRRGIIRCIGDPEEKFVQDPVRMIRVIRHAARTGFTIEEKTYGALIRHMEKVCLCSPARVREEFMRELREGSAEESMKLMLQTGLLFILFPPGQLPLSLPGQREYFLQMAAALDELRLAGNTPAEEFCLALFLLPWLEFYCPPSNLPPGRKGQTFFQERVREWVLETLAALQFPPQAKEMTSRLLSAQRIFQKFLPQQKLPWGFMRKPYFPQARQLFEMGARARGENGKKYSWPEEQRKPSRRRRKRRPHSQTQGAPFYYRPPGGEQKRKS